MQPVLPAEKREVAQAGFRLLKAFAEDQQRLLTLDLKFRQPPCGTRSGQSVDLQRVWDRFGNVSVRHRKCGEGAVTGLLLSRTLAG